MATTSLRTVAKSGVVRPGFRTDTGSPRQLGLRKPDSAPPTRQFPR
jgi:hypothetical protein